MFGLSYFCSKRTGKQANLAVQKKFFMNGLDGNPAGNAVPAQIPIYRDIYDYFMFIRSQLDYRKGTYIFNLRKKLYCEQINTILACASQLSFLDNSTFVNPHEQKLEGNYMDLESEFIRTIHYSLQVCIVTVSVFSHANV